MQFTRLTASFLLQLATLINASPIGQEAIDSLETRQDPAVAACYNGVTAQVNACYSGCGISAVCYASW